MIYMCYFHGILEFWKSGTLGLGNHINLIPTVTHYSITPLFHYSN